MTKIDIDISFALNYNHSMKNDISVIIPYYNSIKTLPKMLDSILSGLLVPSQIILINDGSTDGSDELCLEYSKKYECITVLSQEHQGVSAARNLGLSKATGQWISFLDSDDYIEPDMFSLMHTALQSPQSNFNGCICGYYTHKDSVITPYALQTDSVLTSEKLLKLMFTSESVRGFLCTRLFNKKLLNDMQFDQDISYCEDLLFQTKLFSTKNVKFAIVNKPLYHYIMNSNSTTQKLNFFNNGTFVYKPAYEKIKLYYLDDHVEKSYDDTLNYCMYSLLKAYQHNKKPEIIHQIRQLQFEIKKLHIPLFSKSKRGLAFELAPIIYSHFMK